MRVNSKTFGPIKKKSSDQRSDRLSRSCLEQPIILQLQGLFFFFWTNEAVLLLESTSYLRSEEVVVLSLSWRTVWGGDSGFQKMDRQFWSGALEEEEVPAESGEFVHIGGGEVCQSDALFCFFWLWRMINFAFTVARVHREACFHFTPACWLEFCWNNRLSPSLSLCQVFLSVSLKNSSKFPAADFCWCRLSRRQREDGFSTRAGIELRDLCDRAAARIRNRFLLRRACVRAAVPAGGLSAELFSSVFTITVQALAASLVCLRQCNSFLVHVWGQSGCYSFPLFTFGPKYKGETQMFFVFFLTFLNLCHLSVWYVWRFSILLFTRLFFHTNAFY